MDKLTLADLFNQNIKYEKAKSARTKAEKKESVELRKLSTMMEEFDGYNILYCDNVTNKTYFFDGYRFTAVNE